MHMDVMYYVKSVINHLMEITQILYHEVRLIFRAGPTPSSRGVPSSTDLLADPPALWAVDPLPPVSLRTLDDLVILELVADLTFDVVGFRPLVDLLPADLA